MTAKSLVFCENTMKQQYQNYGSNNSRLEDEEESLPIYRLFFVRSRYFVTKGLLISKGLVGILNFSKNEQKIQPTVL